MTAHVESGRHRQLAAQGLGVSLENPRSILFFPALFPQFIVPDVALATQYLLLATTFAGCAPISHAHAHQRCT